MALKVMRSPSSQISFDLVLLNRRLNELSYIAGKRNYPLFLPTSLRFASLAGDLTNTSLSSNLIKKEEILKVFAEDENKIGKILIAKDKTEEWKYIHDDINYLSIYSGKLSHPNL